MVVRVNKAQPRRPKPGLLLVEDDADLADMYRLQLIPAGYQVYIARDVASAIDILDTKPIRLILLDILLPEQNGLNILHELRTYEDWRQLPVVVLSNLSARELGLSSNLLEQLGVQIYLNKSHTRAKSLVAAVNSASQSPKS